MGEFDISRSTTTQLKSGVPDYKVQPQTIDEAGVSEETYWSSPLWSTYLGYLKTIPEYRNAVRTLSNWTCGRGWSSPSNKTTSTLERIRGAGEDSFDSIMADMIVVKKTNGDAYCEIIRNDNGTLINLKKLNPSKVRSVWDTKGLIIGYDLMQGDGEWHRLAVDKIFHIMNDRIANEIHGTSVLESCKWVIDWKNEMLSDLRRIMHRSTIRVLYVDEDNTSKLNTYREQYKEAIKNGEVLIMPGKPNDAQFSELNIPPTEVWMNVIRYADDYFYEILNVPRIMTGSVNGATEASSKVGYLVFEQPYMTEQRLLEQDLWNQLAIRITFERPVSLKEPLQTSEAGNTGQVGFQQSEMMPGRNE